MIIEEWQFERNEFYANRKKRFEKRWRCPPKKKKYDSLTVDNREENKLEGCKGIQYRGVRLIIRKKGKNGLNINEQSLKYPFCQFSVFLE